VLGDSYIWLQPNFEHPTTANGMELLHSAAERDWSEWLIIAVPAALPSNDPCRPLESERRVTVLLPLGIAFQSWAQHRRRSDIRRGEHVRRRHLADAAAALRQLDVDARRFGLGGSELYQPIRRGHLAVLQLQPRDFITRNNCSITQRSWYQLTISQAPTTSGRFAQSAQPAPATRAAVQGPSPTAACDHRRVDAVARLQA
jgi:hypothetical protein